MPAPLYRYREDVKAANDVWRRLIYTYAKPPGACAVNGCMRGLQAMHLFPKKPYPHLRFDPENGAPGCPGCHTRLTNDHEAHRAFCIRYLGPERYEALRLRSLCKSKVDVVAAHIALTAMLKAAEGPEPPYEEEDGEE
jgi:hypothetical protein